MASETTTPNVGFQIPGYNQPNWNVPIVYDLNLLDLIFGGEFTIPALSVTNFIIANIGIQVAKSFISEAPAGVIPGNVYTLSKAPTVLFGFYWNGVFQRPVVDYTLTGAVVTMTTQATSAGDNVWAVYLS